MKSTYRVLSSLTTNIAAGWIGLSLFIPDLSKLLSLSTFEILLKNILLAIIFLGIAIYMDKKSQAYYE